MPVKKKSDKKIIHETVIRRVIEKPVRKKPVKKRKKPVRKKIIRRKKPIKRRPTPRVTLPKNDLRIEKALIENFIGIQKVMVNLSVKFDELSNNISKLLDLFEISAKALAEKDLTMERTERDDTKIIKKMDNMFEQNRILARGLTLINNKLDEEPGYPNVQKQAPPTPKTPFDNPFKPTPESPSKGYSEKITAPVERTHMEGYQESISRSKPTFKRLPKQ